MRIRSERLLDLVPGFIRERQGASYREERGSKSDVEEDVKG